MGELEGESHVSFDAENQELKITGGLGVIVHRLLAQCIDGDGHIVETDFHTKNCAEVLAEVALIEAEDMLNAESEKDTPSSDNYDGVA